MYNPGTMTLPTLTLPTQADSLDFTLIAKNVVGHRQEIETIFGKKQLIYADWIASGRLYEPIEKLMTEHFGPWVGNTHSESSYVGEVMTTAYKMAHRIIKDHVHADGGDVIICCGSGMTGAVSKLQRILGLHIPDRAKAFYHQPANERPVVFITHMEHHSNQTSWL